MARTNFQYEKRQRELEKKRKAEEKAKRKQEAKSQPGDAAANESDEPPGSDEGHVPEGAAQNQA